MPRDLIALAAWASGVPWLVRMIIARRRVTVVNYHCPDAKVFRAHLDAFAKRYNFVALEDVLGGIAQRDFSLLPDYPMLITLDDGYKENAFLFRILEEFDVPAVIYVVAGTVGTNREFWFEVVKQDRGTLKTMMSLPDSKRREFLETEFDHTDHREYEMRRALSVEEIQAFFAVGGTVGSHSLFHPMLDQCKVETIDYECVASKARLEKLTCSDVADFALPGGRGLREALGSIEQSGYRSCRTTKPGWVSESSDPLGLPNFGVADDAGVFRAVVQASGVWDYAKLLLRPVGSFGKRWWNLRQNDDGCWPKASGSS